MSDPNVFAVIVNWNGLSDTLECLESLRRLDYPNVRVVLVDNASADGSADAIRKAHAWVRVLENGSNLGFTGGNNAGIRFALDNGADYVWLLNNDTTVDRRALSCLVKAAESDPSAGIFGSKIRCSPKRDVISYAGAAIDWERGRSPHTGRGESDRGQYDVAREVDRVSGCSMMVRKDVWERVGLLDDDFFLYAEDVEWCVRARAAGYRCMYVPGSLVFHKEAASATGADGSGTLYFYYNTRNFLKTIAKHHRFPSRERLLLKVVLGHLRYRKRSLLNMVLRGAGGSGRVQPEDRAVLLGIRDFFGNRMGKRDDWR